MYLVCSVELDQLSPNDKLRRALISHFTTLYIQDEQYFENLRIFCESDFEFEVYDVLTELGYRVVPQVKVGGFCIDLVVEGHSDSRLAIECDGYRSTIVEIAFYGARPENSSAVDKLGDDKLKLIAHEVLVSLRANISVDWAHRESVRARLRVSVKNVLKKYGYPPDMQDAAVQTALQQAEALSATWV